MKFKDYLKKLNDFAASNPESLEMDVIYSKDDEGNGYQFVNDQDVVVGMFDGKYHGEFIYDEEDIAELEEEYAPNAVIIN